jgi:poly [ADP-ribose] polymerase
MLLTARFRKEFRERTGLSWNDRYQLCPWLARRFYFVELDYRCSSARQLVKELPVYKEVDIGIPEEVQELMETMLYGSPVRKDTGAGKEGPAAAATSRFGFSAPYEQLSSWSLFLGFKTLQRISDYLSSDRAMSWKALLRASSLYRTQIPCCAGHNRAPVISGYQAVLHELKLLYSLWPRLEVLQLLKDVHARGSLQLRTHKLLTQPLYRAYSSLRHGFRRLSDPTSLEFRHLSDYLLKSCHPTHRLRLELLSIHRVFLKPGLPNPYRDWLESKLFFGGDRCGEERRLLWHGTPLDSLLGILDLGLQIRRRGATWTGTMFGNGIYLADASSKSATFCKHHLWDGEAVLLLCEADVGRQRFAGVKAMEQGHEVVGQPGSSFRCVEGFGKVGPAAWKDVDWTMAGEPSGGVVRMVSCPSPPFGESACGPLLTVLCCVV